MSSLSLETRIDRVTVYRNGALVLRTGTLDLSAPLPATLLIPGLPLLFNSDSLRIRPGGGLVAGPVEEAAELGLRTERRNPDEAAREALQLEQEALTAEKKAWTVVENFYNKLFVADQLDLAPEAEPVWPTPALWAELHDLALRGHEGVHASRLVLRDRLRDIEERLKALDRKVALASPGEVARYTRALRTTLRGEASGTVAFEVEYFVSGARWAPSYALDLSGDGAANLRLSAWVAQATGEDWSGAEIRVATSDLRRDTTLPKLAAWKIGRAMPPSTGGWRPLPEDLDSLFADADRAAAARPAGPPRPARPQAPELAKKARRQAEMAPMDSASPPAADEAAESFFSAPVPRPTTVSAQAVARSAPQAPGAPPPPPAPMSAGAPKSASLFRSRNAGPPPAPMMSMDEMDDEGGFQGGEPLAGRGGGGGGRAPPPPPPLAPAARLLDYAWLRLPEWTERGRRGRLFPVDAFADLRALAEERGDASRYTEVERALSALRRALHQLGQAPLPPGCTAPDDASFPWVSPPGARVDLPADGQFHQVAIASATGKASTLFRAVPRQTPQVFRYARLPNPLRAPLAPGPLRVTLDGDFCANAAVRSVGAGSVLLLNLGVEEGVRLARNVSFTETEKGVLSSTTVVGHQVKIEVRSRLARPAVLQIFERLPLAPEGSELSVTLEACSQPPTRDLDAADETTPGALRWEMTVPPGQKAELSWAYAVRVPARMEVVGGNRRDS